MVVVVVVVVHANTRNHLQPMGTIGTATVGCNLVSTEGTKCLKTLHYTSLTALFPGLPR